MSALEKLGFVLICKEDGTYIKLEDVKVDNKKVDEYISIAGVRNYDASALHTAIANKKHTTLRFSRDIISPFNELVKVEMSSDKMEAKVKFYPPTDGYNELTEGAILEQLKSMSVTYGIKKDVFDEIINKREYFTEYLIAEGVAPIEHKPATIDYKFDIKAKINRTSKRKEDGTIVYSSVEIVNPVSEGDLLAEVLPRVEGKDGTDVSGENVRPKDIVDAHIVSGNNVEISEDGLYAYSKCDGQAFLRAGKIYVDNVYIVQGDVELSTGHISFNGDILVNGNVRTGMMLNAKGNIEINGVVEGAQIRAGKNILIRDGIQGMKKAYIIAEEDVTTKFIESAYVVAKGYINASSILYSNIISDSGVFVKGPKALIVGGHIKALGHVECDKVGSVMGTSTILQIGYPENAQEISDNLVSEISSIEEKKDELLQVVRFYKNNYNSDETTDELDKRIRNVVDKYREVVVELDQKRIEFNRLKDLLIRTDIEDDMVIISSYVYQGVKVEINGASTYVREGISGSVFRKKGKDRINITPR